MSGAQIGAARLAKQLGSEIVPFVPEKPDDLDEQLGNIRDAMALRPDAILISPVAQPLSTRNASQAVRDAGIVLAYASHGLGGCLEECLRPDTIQGTGIARYLVDHLGGRGKVAILDGLAQSPTSPPRSKAFRDVVAANPGIELVAAQSGDYQFAGGKSQMARFLATQPDLDGVISANDIMALGALEAMKEAGRYIPIVGGRTPCRMRCKR